jgi:hypothetical protein
MLKRLMLFTAAAAFLLTAAGCANTLRVTRLIPPADDIRGIRNIVVLAVVEDFSLEGRAAVRDLADFLKIYVRKAGVFKNVDEQTWDSMRQTGDGNASILPGDGDLKKIASQSDADAVLMVRIADFDAQVIPPSPFQAGVSYGRVGRYGSTWVDWESNDSYRIFGSMNAVISIKRPSDPAGNSERKIPVRLQKYMYSALNGRDLVYAMAQEAAAKYLEFITIRKTAAVRLLLCSARNEPSNRACRMAYGGMWRDAVKIWEELADNDPKDPAPAFNLGVYHELLKNYETAYNCYLAARKITGVEDAFTAEIEQSGASALAASILQQAADEEAAKPGDAPAPPKIEEPLKPAAPDVPAPAPDIKPGEDANTDEPDGEAPGSPEEEPLKPLGD